MLPIRASLDDKCHWSILENFLAKNELVVINVALKTCSRPFHASLGGTKGES